MVATYKITRKQGLNGGTVTQFIQVEGVTKSTQAMVAAMLCVNNHLPSANVEFVGLQDHAMTYTFNEATTEQNLFGGL